jgi:starvation-inducible DNA-binding protein
MKKYILKEHVMNLNIGLQPEQHKKVGIILNTLLADEYMLYTKTLNYHWNVQGMQFNDLHLFFRQQYEQLFTIMDDVAERARSIGSRALGTLTEFSNHTRLHEHEGVVPTALQMLQQLLEDHETIIRALRIDLETCLEQSHDAGTNNFLTDIMETHEKMAWMLRSYLA